MLRSRNPDEDRANLTALFMMMAVAPLMTVKNDIKVFCQPPPMQGNMSTSGEGMSSEPFDWPEYGGQFIDFMRDAMLETARRTEKLGSMMHAYDKALLSNEQIIFHLDGPRVGPGGMADVPIMYPVRKEEKMDPIFLERPKRALTIDMLKAFTDERKPRPPAIQEIKTPPSPPRQVRKQGRRLFVR